MMSLSEKWQVLESKKTEGTFKTLRFDADGPLEVFLGLDENSNHSILIYLSPSYKPTFNIVHNDNIELLFFKEGHFLLIRLLESDFNSLFDDLIISLIDSISQISESLEASKVFVITYIKWSSFFTKSNERNLSKEQCIGLWGELRYLSDLIESNSADLSINQILKAWVGPYDATHDFELTSLSVEVKTKLTTSSKVKISSEFQLDNIESKSLLLNVFSIIETEQGFSVVDLFNDIKLKTLERGGDITILLAALEKQCLNEQRLSKYSNMQFYLKKKEVFDCDIVGFPRIIRTNLSSSISSVKYSLDINELEKYKTLTEKY